MSDIVKSEQTEKPSTLRTRRRQPKEKKAVIDPVQVEQTSAIAESGGLVDMVETLADAEMVAAAGAFDRRMAENLPRLFAHCKKVTTMTASALRAEIKESYGLTEQDIYGE